MGLQGARCPLQPRRYEQSSSASRRATTGPGCETNCALDRRIVYHQGLNTLCGEPDFRVEVKHEPRAARGVGRHLKWRQLLFNDDALIRATQLDIRIGPNHHPTDAA